MKLFLSLLLFFICYQANAQISNKIAEVKELNIYGKDANIIIGKIIVNVSSDPPPLKLLQSVQQELPNKSYLTIFVFGHNSPTPIYNVDLKLVFNQPIDSLSDNEGVISTFTYPNQHTGLDTKKLVYTFQATEVEASIQNVAAFIIRIYSKTKIQTTVTGVDAN